MQTMTILKFDALDRLHVIKCDLCAHEFGHSFSDSNDFRVRCPRCFRSLTPVEADEMVCDWQRRIILLSRAAETGK